MRGWFITAVAISAVAVTAACGGDGASPSAPTSTSSAAAAPTQKAATSAAASATTVPAGGTVVPTADPAFGGYPPGTRTGIAPVDKAIAAILAADPNVLANSISFGGFPCTTTAAPGRPPCTQGAPEGTRVFVFQAANCGYGYVQPTEVTPFLQQMARPGQKLYGVWRRTTPLGSPEYTLLFEGPPAAAGGPPTASIADVDESGIKAMTFACGGSPEEYLAVQKPDNFILQPPRK